MTLENTAIAEMPAAGQETATAPEIDSNELETRHAGILDIDAPEPAEPGNQEADAEVPEASEEDAEPTEEANPWEGYEEVEIDGEVFKVPAKIKDGYMRLADYTRKRQADAELSKQLQAKEQELSKKYERSEEEFSTWMELTQVSNQLKQAEGIDWAAESQRLMSDPRQETDYIAWDKDYKQLQHIYTQFQQLREKEAGLLNSTKQFEQQRTEAAQQDIAKRLQETAKFAQEKIKGWTPELDSKITDFAKKELGYTQEILSAGINPANYRTLYLAYLGHQSQSRQQTARPSPNAAPLAKTQAVSAKANAAVSLDPETMSIDDYVKARTAGKLK